MAERAFSNLCGVDSTDKIGTDEFVVLALKFPTKLMH